MTNSTSKRLEDVLARYNAHPGDYGDLQADLQTLRHHGSPVTTPLVAPEAASERFQWGTRLPTRLLTDCKIAC